MILPLTRRGVLSAAVSLALAALAPLAAADAVHLATSEYPPYMSASLPDKGVEIAITVEAFKRAGYAAQISFLPWARLMSESKAGRVDGVAGMWKSAEREQWYVFSNATAPTQLGLYRRADKAISYQNLTELKSYTVGTVRGYANPKAFDDAKLKVDEVVDDETNLRKLLGGRLDLILIDKGVANHLINSKVPEAKGKLAWIEPAVEKQYLHIAISKQAPNYEKKLAAFNQGLALMEKDGTLAKMISQAGL